jgi:hypothetical protein
MLPDYRDIKQRIAALPTFYDEHGVPRYNSFHPDMLGAYASYAALIEVACQECAKTFIVAMSYSDLDRATCPGLHWPPLPKRNTCGLWHYGDPPAHGRRGGPENAADVCAAGDTMNVACVQIVEFWRKDCDGCRVVRGGPRKGALIQHKGCTRWEWRRDPKFEFRWPSEDVGAVST